MTRRCSPGSVTDSFASYGDVAFVTLSRFATEGNDLAMVNDEGKRMLELDDNEKAIFQKIKDSGKFKKTVVLLNSVFAMEMDWLDEYNVDAVLWVGNPGFYGMPGAIRVVTGEVNPSGHTTAHLCRQLPVRAQRRKLRSARLQLRQQNAPRGRRQLCQL